MGLLYLLLTENPITCSLLPPTFSVTVVKTFRLAKLFKTIRSCQLWYKISIFNPGCYCEHSCTAFQKPVPHTLSCSCKMIFLEPLQNFFVQNSCYVSAENHAFNLFMYKKKRITQEYQMEIFLRQSSTSFGFDKLSIPADIQTEGITCP